MISDQDMVELSCYSAYQYYSVGEEFLVNGNKYIVVDVFNSNNGYKYGLDAMLVENSDGNNAVIFTGSDRKRDFFNDWIINNGSNALGLDVLQYKEGLSLVDELNAKGIEVERVGGVSLGGGIASYIGVNNENISALAVNPAPQTEVFTNGYSNLKVVIDKADPLYAVSIMAGRKEYFPGEIFKFNRENSMFDFYLNHKGHSSDLNISIDEQYPFDLMTNNISNHKIDFNSDDLLELNSNYQQKLASYNYEYEHAVKHVILNGIKEDIDTIKFHDVYVKIVDEINSYFASALPTLNYYIKFRYFFDELKNHSYIIYNELLAKLIEFLYQKLELYKLKENISNDCSSAIFNFRSLNEYVTDIIGKINLHTNSFVSADNGVLVENRIMLQNIILLSGSNSKYLSYFKIYDLAKETIFYFIDKKITSYFKVLDTKIDSVIGAIKKVVTISSEVIALTNGTINEEIQTVEQIVNELYDLDVGEVVAKALRICVDEVIAIVIPENIVSILAAFKRLGGICANINAVNDNYLNYIDTLQGESFNLFTSNILDYSQELKRYNTYLKTTYI